MTMIFVYPGQGSQELGMGEALFEQFAPLVEKASHQLGYDLRDLCVNGPAEKLNDTQYTQPALFAVNALSHMAKVEELGREPDFVAGHSLGEYDALFAAGVFDFLTGLRLVERRGQLMAQAASGGMAAVLGLPVSQIRNALVDHGHDDIDVANLNTHGQTVISGPRESIVAAEGAIKDAGAKRYVVLNVSGAFHSRYMAHAASDFGDFLKGFEFHAPRIPVIANYTAEPYGDDAESVMDNLTKQIEKSVRWVETIELLMKQDDAEFIEVGPRNVLAGMIRQIQRGS